MHRAFAVRSSLVLAAKPNTQAHRFASGAQRARLLVCASAAPAALAGAQLQPVAGAQLPSTPGVYAIYDGAGKLQYVGLTRVLAKSVEGHAASLPELVHSVRVVEVPGGDKESLTETWKAWVSEAVSETGEIPPGNAPGETRWQARRSAARAKPEVRLTPGKGLQDLTCSVEDLIDAVVKGNKVVVFVKGTRVQPQCGFSYRVLTILNEYGVDYEVVNVLDEVYNPGVRDAIKNYSQWPTIPQIFIGSEFVGGADIVEEMHTSGELKKLLQG
ncbi:hypothetical protein N2152v2_011227 [Parachlorella kessleri]